MRDGVEGLVTEPGAKALAAAFDKVYHDRDAAERMGRNSHDRRDEFGFNWPNPIALLIGDGTSNCSCPTTPHPSMPIRTTSGTASPERSSTSRTTRTSAARGAAAREFVGQRSGSAYAEAILVAAERALAARPMTVLDADLNRRLERIGLHHQPAVVDLVSDVDFELVELG